jgi:hypothetical protein
MNLFENLQEILFEEVYGNKAVVYHRTKLENLINKIYTKGFKPGNGDFYGKGFYATQDLKSQLRSTMKRKYGPMIIKFIVNSLNKFLYFDYEEFIKSPVSKKISFDKNNFIINQLKYYGFDKIKPINDSDLILKDGEDSSNIAQRVFNRYKMMPKLIDGIVFSGKSDGKVLVSYNTSLIIPISYTLDENKTWQKIKNNEYHQKVFDQNTTFYGPKTLNQLIKNHWITKAKISEDSKFEFDVPEHKFIWYSGTWKDGIWEHGIWKRGTWEKGTWEDGTWEEGTWKKGTWESGVWRNGTWESGTWESGVWRGGIWLGGIWEGGYDIYKTFHPEGDSPDKWTENHWIFNADISKNSDYSMSDSGVITWHSGTWNYGTWENGTWEKGTWRNGTWKKGLWIRGTWERGTWEKGRFIGGTWEDGIWEYGTWRGGTWEKGTWLDGKWLYGTWLGGYDKYGKYHSEGDSPDKWNI